jgi:hypothetical protein
MAVRCDMKIKLVNISEVTTIPPVPDLTPEEEAALIADYIKSRTQEQVEADYRDFDRQFAEGIPAEQLLRELEADTSAE